MNTSEIVRKFRDAAASNPSRKAVIGPEISYTYEELARRSAAVASRGVDHAKKA